MVGIQRPVTAFLSSISLFAAKNNNNNYSGELGSGSSRHRRIRKLGSVTSKFKSYITGRIAPDEEVLLFPTMANEVNETHWHVPIHGWIFEPERNDTKRRAFLKILRTALKIDDTHDEDSSSSNKEIFNRRAQWFLVDNERWKSPKIHLLLGGDDGSDDKNTSRSSAIVRTPLSSKNGHFEGSVMLPKAEMESAIQEDGLLPMEVRAPDGRIFRGCVHCIPDTGVSVISDIDDTIKITNVTDKKKMLQLTFLKDFRAVPGMAKLYQDMQTKYNTIKFHFVSSSPYQLYDELETFRQEAGFPPATYHLKRIRPKDKSILNLFADPFKTKTATITAIVDRFPKRQYILIGDSGEKDPEVYGNLARLYPKQIAAIYIRNASFSAKEPPPSALDMESRMEVAFANISSTKWKVFNDPSEINPSLLEQALTR